MEEAHGRWAAVLEVLIRTIPGDHPGSRALLESAEALVTAPPPTAFQSAPPSAQPHLPLSLSSSLRIVFIYLFLKYLFGYFRSQLPHLRSSLRRPDSLLHGLLSSCGVSFIELGLSSDGVQA